jgi:hypothetical protein
VNYRWHIPTTAMLVLEKLMLNLESPNKLRVLAEYESSGIWLSEPNGVSEVKHEDLGLPQDLSERFCKWIVLYYERLTEAAIPLDQFNEIGRSLAKDLKAFVGPDVVVEYIPELPGDTEGPPEVVE